jgi:hypothetical protein
MRNIGGERRVLRRQERHPRRSEHVAVPRKDAATHIFYLGVGARLGRRKGDEASPREKRREREEEAEAVKIALAQKAES